MAYLLSSERPAVAAASRNPLLAILRWAAKLRAERHQRLAFREMLEFDEARLEDLGLTRNDVLEAMGASAPQAGLHLQRRRALRSAIWLGRSSF
ncbi:hypothetical protein SAMN02983003_3303 [Devosia enhydra]|uniref:DUF1127 domain-containing protein n=1 Tax=Devosia enhydra TaxID=665118 RepID=A0A1K2I1C7_9HYPH|nr:hypothetical protein [Devosia enhydra]SFZ86129.1 hypothetical protein SAMN02983003_3303 [Devosia enhydra]